MSEQSVAPVTATGRGIAADPTWHSEACDFFNLQTDGTICTCDAPGEITRIGAGAVAPWREALLLSCPDCQGDGWYADAIPGLGKNGERDDFGNPEQIQVECHHPRLPSPARALLEKP